MGKKKNEIIKSNVSVEAVANEVSETVNADAGITVEVAYRHMTDEEITVDGIEISKEIIIPIKKPRRVNGSGSVYPIGDKCFGFCIGLLDANNAEHKELKKKHGNKLRYLGTAKTKSDCEEKCKQAIVNKENLLQEKLKKLNHFENK